MLLVHVVAHVLVDADNLANDLDPHFQREFHRLMRVCGQLAFQASATGSHGLLPSPSASASHHGTTGGIAVRASSPGTSPGRHVRGSTTPPSEGRFRFMQHRSASATGISDGSSSSSAGTSTGAATSGDRTTADGTHSRLFASASMRRLRVNMPSGSGGGAMVSPTLGITTTNLDGRVGFDDAVVVPVEAGVSPPLGLPSGLDYRGDDDDEDVESAFTRVSVRDVSDKFATGSIVDRLTHFRAFGKRKELQVGCA